MSVLRENKNCWKIALVKRGGFLVDCAAYFRNLYEAMLQAEESIFILGWDIDTRIKLIPYSPDPQIPVELGPFLNYLVQKKKNLKIYILMWDYYSILAFERELFVRIKLGWMGSKRIQFRLDSEFPLGASHHQKIVVIDDQVAFCGGIDISSERWDTPSHRKKNKHRKNHIGMEYEPQHDLQMMVEGEAAYWMGKLARTRWKRATGEEISFASFEEKNHRFEQLEWNFNRANVAISRTEPAYKNHREVHEVEHLFLDLIKTTRHHLYIENQYFTSQVIFQALRKSLVAKQGPEITIILPKESAYWVENYTMGSLQAVIVKKLYETDLHQRLGIFCPVYDEEKSRIKIHSKTMICDDRYARIGSANISNRSLGLDSECDLTLDGSRQKELQKSISELKQRLLAEHLNTSLQTVKNVLEEKKSINQFIRTHRRKGRHLEEMKILEPNSQPLLNSELLDLESPLEIDRVFDTFGAEIPHQSFFRSTPFLIGTCLGFLLLAFFTWNHLPLPETTQVRNFFLMFEHQRFQPLWILGIYSVAGLLFIPINLLILATASIYGGLQAFLYATIGSLLNATVSYWAGNMLGKKTVQKIYFKQIHKIAQRMEKKGTSPIIMVRLLPIAPYSMVNFIAGAFKIPLKHYLLGTLIGMVPGTILLILFQRNLLEIIQNPNASNILVFLLVLGFITAGILYVRKRTTIHQSKIRQ